MATLSERLAAAQSATQQQSAGLSLVDRLRAAQIARQNIATDPNAPPIPEPAMPDTKVSPGAEAHIQFGRHVVKPVDDTVRAIGEGLTFGWSPEIAAVARSATGPMTLDQALAEETKRQNQIDPALRMAGNIGGGMLTGGATAKLAQMAAPALPAALRFGGLGLVEGATAGAGYTDGGLDDRLGGAAVGGATGLGIGAAVPVVAQTARAGWQALTNPGQAGARRATRRLATSLQRDAMTPETVTQRLREMGPEATIADAGGRNTQQLARTAASTPGRAQDVADDLLDQRQYGAGQRISQFAQRLLGKNANYAEDLAALDDVMKKSAKPLYDKAYQKVIPQTDKLRSLADRDVMKKAVENARRIASNEGEEIPEFVTDKSLRYGMSAKAWDYVKRGIDDVLESYRDKTTGKLVLDTEGRSINQVRRELLDELDSINPDYAKARAAYAGPASAKDAMVRGRGFIRGDEMLTKKQVEAMTPAELEFFKVGVARGIHDKVTRPLEGINVARQIGRSGPIKEKLAIIFGDDGAKEFLKKIAAEEQFSKTRQIVQGGSKTDANLLAAQDAGLSQTVMDTARGGARGAAMGMVERATNKLFGPSEATSERLAEALFSQNKAKQDAALKALQQSALMNAIINPGFGGVPVVGAQETVKSLNANR